MKKIRANRLAIIVLVVTLAFVFCGCGSSKTTKERAYVVTFSGYQFYYLFDTDAHTVKWFYYDTGSKTIYSYAEGEYDGEITGDKTLKVSFTAEDKSKWIEIFKFDKNPQYVGITMIGGTLPESNEVRGIQTDESKVIDILTMNGYK